VSNHFLALKHCLTNAPLLVCPDVKKPYEVVTDASTVGIGAVLLQDSRPIAFESRKLSDAEKNYHTTEQEMLAVVHALKTWRYYLEGATFTVVTDHVSNTFFDTQPSLSRRQTRWSEFLQRFRPFQWSYKAGRTNIADPLSRYPVDTLAGLYVGSRGHRCAIRSFSFKNTIKYSYYCSSQKYCKNTKKYVSGTISDTICIQLSVK
jgi:hypothetical protein